MKLLSFYRRDRRRNVNSYAGFHSFSVVKSVGKSCNSLSDMMISIHFWSKYSTVGYIPSVNNRTTPRSAEGMLKWEFLTQNLSTLSAASHVNFS